MWVDVAVGSSPRVRGKLGLTKNDEAPERLIPACAGKTPYCPFNDRRARAHPRVCGENEPAIPQARKLAGSSPRVRGKLTLSLQAKHNTGLIPACAGKTLSPAPWLASPRAHPRVCGENVGLKPRRVALGGSSPRVRGKQMFKPEVDRRARLIPACAGKTRTPHGIVAEYRAHPRVCGENRTPNIQIHPTPGSSPRVRGKLSRHSTLYAVIGLIPACAGKTWTG